MTLELYKKKPSDNDSKYYDYRCYEYPDEDEEIIDFMRERYIKCPKCNNRTSYGFFTDSDLEICSFYCFNCKGTISVHNCVDNYETNKCSLMLLITKDLVEYDHWFKRKSVCEEKNTFDKYYINYTKYINETLPEKYGINLKIEKIHSDICDDKIQCLIFDENEYIYYDYINKLEPFTGPGGGWGPTYKCKNCGMVCHLSDK
jgi:hypothetical protein